MTCGTGKYDNRSKFNDVIDKICFLNLQVIYGPKNHRFRQKDLRLKEGDTKPRTEIYC